MTRIAYWSRMASTAFAAAVVALWGACSFQAGYVLPASLQLAIEGRPVVDGPGTTVLRLGARSNAPYAEVCLAGPFGHTARVMALVDTGALLYMDLPWPLAERVRPWIWRDSIGRVRTWSFGEGAASLGVLDHIDLGDIRLSHVPVLVSPRNRRFGDAILGIQALAMFDSVECEWQEERLVLHRTRVEPTAAGAPRSGGRVSVPLEWWQPVGDAASRDRGYVTVLATVHGHQCRVLLDTGYEGDLLLPNSLAAQEPWVSCLEDAGAINVHGANNTMLTKRVTLRADFLFGGQSFANLLVAVFDEEPLTNGTCTSRGRA
ncbi:MAG: aspartyl protease family protein, partial [Phycisphaeraceae bacterium]|nr:aspartyl protease family protein [Phycisphaeraceae bacterium]